MHGAIRFLFISRESYSIGHASLQGLDKLCECIRTSREQSAMGTTSSRMHSLGGMSTNNWTYTVHPYPNTYCILSNRWCMLIVLLVFQQACSPLACWNSCLRVRLNATPSLLCWAGLWAPGAGINISLSCLSLPPPPPVYHPYLCFHTPPWRCGPGITHGKQTNRPGQQNQPLQ